VIEWRTCRIIVTGERDWTDDFAVRNQLNGCLRDEYARLHRPPTPLTIVHGDCIEGADAIAAMWVRDVAAAGYAVVEEPHPYKSELGLGGGPARNGEIARAGADLCLAFWSGTRWRLKNGRRSGSGTLDCIAQCVENGIPVRIIPRRRA